MFDSKQFISVFYWIITRELQCIWSRWLFLKLKHTLESSRGLDKTDCGVPSPDASGVVSENLTFFYFFLRLIFFLKWSLYPMGFELTTLRSRVASPPTEPGHPGTLRIYIYNKFLMDADVLLVWRPHFGL